MKELVKFSELSKEDLERLEADRLSEAKRKGRNLLEDLICVSEPEKEKS